MSEKREEWQASDLERSKHLFKEYLKNEYHKRSRNYERDYNMLIERIECELEEPPKTLQSLADKYLVSKERIAQVFGKAFRCARAYYAKDGIELVKRSRSYI